MGSLSNYAEMKLLDHAHGTAYSPQSTVYLCLYESDPTDADSGSETSYTNYVRQAVEFNAAASRAIVQTNDETFPSNGSGTVTITHWGIRDQAAAGNLLAHGSLSASKQVTNGDTPKIEAAEITISVTTGGISTYLVHKLLDLMFRNVAYSAPSTYVGLSTTALADADAGSDATEPAGGAYARKQVNANGGAVPDWDLAVSGDPSYVDNNDQIDFTDPTADWGTVEAVFTSDSPTTGAGNILFYDNAPSKPVNNGDSVYFPAGDWDSQMS